MTTSFTQIPVPGGYDVVIEADLPDGHLRVESAHQTIFAEADEPVGGYVTKRTAWLDGELVTDPARAQALFEQATGPP